MGLAHCLVRWCASAPYERLCPHSIILALDHFSSTDIDLSERMLTLSEAGDELITASIKRAQQDAKITGSNFMPKDFVDWNIVRAIQRDLKR
jgi:propanediol dehydratase large subunit